jgi:hypothetical protein
VVMTGLVTSGRYDAVMTGLVTGVRCDVVTAKGLDSRDTHARGGALETYPFARSSFGILERA